MAEIQSRIKAAHDDCNFILEFVKDDEDDNFIKISIA